MVNQEKVKKDKGLENKLRIQKYLVQPERLDKDICNHPGLENNKILFYAYIDLDDRYNLSANWLVLTENHLSYFEGRELKTVLSVESITSIFEHSGLSSQKMSFYGANDQLLLLVRYSHRQSRAVGSIKFYIDQLLAQAKEDSQGSSAVMTQLKDADSVYQESLLGPINEAQASVAGNKLAVIWRLLGYLKPYRTQLIFGVMGAFAMTLLALVPAKITGYIIDGVIKPYQQGEMLKNSALELIYWAVAGLVAIYVVREIAAYIRLRTMSTLGEYVAKDLRDEVYEHLHKLSLNFFSSKQTGSLISRVGSDTDRIWDFVAFGVVEVTNSIVLLIGLSAVLISLDVQLGLLVTLPVPLFLWAIFKHGQDMQGLFLRAWRKWSYLTDCLSDTIPGIRVVKAFNRQDHETEKFKDRNNMVLKEFVSIHDNWTRFWPLLMLSIQAVIIAVWFFGAPQVLDYVEGLKSGKEIGVSPGTFVAFLLYLTMFVQPIEVIGQMARMVNRATSSAYRVFEVIDTEPQIVEQGSPVILDNLQGEIEFRNVSFSYDGVRKVVKNVSFKIEPGEMIGLVGSSGSGKTTTTHLLARFFEVSEGEIFIDGRNLKSLSLGEYREQIGMVLQDPYLFHGTILENIRYACPEASLEEVLEAARAANAHDFICKFPHAYETIVGERGHTLSGGERQRISIARAILRNPKVLILDEATSAVDTETERKIQDALDNLVKGRTVIAIAHRLSTLQKADRILVMDNGELVEQGSHGDLLAKEAGVYQKLVKLQQTMVSVEV